jgi:hypothetical protein
MHHHQHQQQYITIIQDPYPPLNNSPELIEQINCFNNLQQSTADDDLLVESEVAAAGISDFNNTNPSVFISSDYNRFLPNLKKEQYVSTASNIIKVDCNNNDDVVDMKDFY